MKRILTLLALSLLTAVTAAHADEPRPIVKVMQARLGWVQSMTKQIAYSNYEAIAKDAGELAAQTRKVGEAAPAQFNKEMNLAISDLAKGISDAAAAKDGVAISAKLGDLLGKCNTCHVKLRDKP
jgi:cytochrome c556